jgi:23S rRNA U2552 (ribose-2'-O)-methylase RlmE/FtsJ
MSYFLCKNQVKISPGISIAYDDNFLLLSNNSSIIKIRIEKIELPYLASILLKGFQEKKILDKLNPKQKIEFVNVVNQLKAHHVLVEQHTKYSNEFAQFDRFYGYLKKFNPTNEDSFDKLRQSTILVVGVGTLGSWLSQHLINFCIGNVILLDFDEVRIENISRQSLFDKKSVGDLKINVAKKNLLKLSSHTKIHTINKKITSTRCFEKVIKDLKLKGINPDIILQTADKPIWKISLWTSAVCSKYNIPILRGNSLGVGPFYIPQRETSCIGCEYSKLKKQGLEKIINSRRALSFAPSPLASFEPSLTASIMAKEALMFLIDKHENLLSINGRVKANLDGILLANKDVIEKSKECEICK